MLRMLLELLSSGSKVNIDAPFAAVLDCGIITAVTLIVLFVTFVTVQNMKRKNQK